MEFDQPSLAQRLLQILEPLRAAVAAHAGRRRAAAPLVLLLWPYLRRLALRFAVLAARPAGYVPPPPPPSPARPGRKPTPRLPQRFGWLRRLMPETAAYGGQLQHLFSQPEMAAFLAASPRGGSILRPLCRMFAIDPAPDLPAVLFRRRQPRARRAIVATVHADPRSAATPLPSGLSPKSA